MSDISNPVMVVPFVCCVNTCADAGKEYVTLATNSRRLPIVCCRQWNTMNQAGFMDNIPVRN